MRILVTDGDARATLAVVRALGRSGHYVAVGERQSPALAQSSRYCRERLTYPDPFENGPAFVSWLLSEVQRLGIDVVLPVSDVATALVADHRAEFERICRVPLPPRGALLRAADKADVMRLAETLGVPIPRTFFLEEPAQIEAAAAALTFPVVVKPRRSRVRTEEGWKACSVTYAADLADLRAKVRAWPAAAYPLLLQEKIPGPGLGVFLCIHDGATVAAFSHRRLREKPPSGGVSVLSESVAMRPDLKEYAERLLTALEWNGVAMVEFKLDERDNVPKLMEINGRFWGSLQLAIDAGVDFPSILVDSLTRGGSVAAAPAYRVGVRSRWFWGDVDSLLTTLFGNRQAANFPTPRTKLARVAGFLNFWGKDLHYENPRLGDLGPWRHETVRWVRHLLPGAPAAAPQRTTDRA